VKRLPSVLIILLLAIPGELFAKAETSKIIIKGADLSAPIEITDPKTLANFLCVDGYWDKLHRGLFSAESRELHR
jgi:hypothetical protein